MIGEIIGQEISVNVPKNMKAQVIPQGNSYQATREGYNILPPFESTTLNGITYTKNENGTITVKGTATDNSFYKQEVSLKAGDYILTGSPSGAEDNKYCIQATGYGLGDFGEGQSFKLEQDTIVPIRLMVWSGITVNNLVFKPMIVKGTEKKDYEQYGVSPSLDYPSEVEAVGDNINIFDDTVEKVTSIINDSGNEVADTGTNDFYKQIIIPDSKKYIMSYEKNNQGFVRMAYYNGDTFISRQYSNQNGFIFTVPDNCNKIDCRTNAGTNNEIKFTNLKIEKGEVATSYSPYNQGSVKIVKSNKNLLSFEYKTGNGITFDKNRITIIDPTGYLHAGKTLVGGNSFLSGKKVIFTTISNGTISGTLDFTVHTNKVQYRFQKKHTTGIYNNDIKSEGFMFANDEYITSIFVYTTGATSNLTIDVQVSIADEDFIEHQGNAYSLPIQKPFYKIGDYADAFIKQNNKWYEKHYIKELSLTGDDSETWTAKITDTFSKYQWSRALSDKLNILNSQIFCTHFKQITVAQSDALNIEGIANGLYPDYSLMIVTDKIKSLADFKTKLKELYESGNPIKIYYILKTPELIECTEEQTQILEQLNNLYLYEGINYLYSTDEISPIFKVFYDKIVNDFRFYLSENGKLVFPNENISFLCSISESLIPSMPEALETSAIIAGRDGDVPLNTTYNPLSFELVLYTEDNLMPEEKLNQEEFLTKFCNSIKNNTETFALELAQKFYKIKYNGLLSKENYPKFLKFTLPFKSSKPFAYNIKEKIIYGNSIIESNTIEPTGFKCVIKGPALKPIISLNDYAIEYDNTILEGESLEIDSNNSTVVLVNLDGIKINAMRYYNHQFPKIINGTNELKVLSGIDNPKNVSISWYDLTL